MRRERDAEKDAAESDEDADVADLRLIPLSDPPRAPHPAPSPLVLALPLALSACDLLSALSAVRLRHFGADTGRRFVSVTISQASTEADNVRRFERRSKVFSQR